MVQLRVSDVERLKDLEQRVLAFRWRLALCLDDPAELATAHRRLMEEASEIHSILKELLQQECKQEPAPKKRQKRRRGS